MPLALAQIHSFIRNLNICERQNHKNQNEEKKHHPTIDIVLRKILCSAQCKQLLSFNHKIEHSINLSASSSNDFESNDKIYYCGCFAMYLKRFARKIGDGENSRRTKTASCAAFVTKMCVGPLMLFICGICGIKLDMRSLIVQQSK